ncbi:MAG: HEAT repeat domain-containing protein [Terriglobia bacterium]
MSSALPKRNLAIAIVPALLVLITFLFWYQTWFGRQLSDSEMTECLTENSAPHRTQHALAQLAERITRGDSSARRWYPQVIALASSRESGLRLMAAWTMGQDNRSPEFQNALRRLLDDPEPMVRRNAALGLARFEDASGRGELLAMLRPFTLTAPQAGTLSFRLGVGDDVRNGGIVAQIQPADGKRIDVLAPIAGQVDRRVATEGAAVAVGDPIAILAPSEDQVWESLRALYLIGSRDDLEEVERFMQGAPGTSDRIRQQAAAAAAAIRRRTEPRL